MLVVTASLMDRSRSATFIKYGFTISHFKFMSAIRILLGMFCCAVIGGFPMFGRHLLDVESNVNRQKLVTIAAHELGVRELTNQNDGERVETYLHLAGLKKGDPYCAAFISWIFAQAGFLKPRSGWSPDLFPPSRLARSALPGDVLGIYFPEYGRIAHVGLIEKIEGQWCFSIEANTDVTGGREGGGVYRRRRLIKTIYRIADWVKPGRKIP